MTASTASPAGYALRLLGAFELRDATGALVLSAGKPLSVITYLALARGQRASRQSLVALLWGDVDPERGRASLRQALFALRQRLGVDLIVADGEWLALTAPVATDTRAFLDAVEQGANAQALTFYAGDFIPEFAAPGAADFEAWADMERRRLRGAFLAAARSQVRNLLSGGEAAAAVELSGRLRDAEPEDDEHWRMRFEALALAGRFPVIDLEESALRSARADDERTVDAATEMVLRRLRRAANDAKQAAAVDGPASSLIPADPEFQGRADVFAQLLAAWGFAGRGRAQRRLLVASAGLGKTRLLREFARRLSVQRARALQVSARQGERDDAFGFLAELVTRVAELSGASGVAPASAAVLAGLVPVLADSFNVKPEAGITDPAEVLRRRALAFADLMGAVADDRPLALLLDDLQWADVASLQAIDRAFARVPRVPVLVVGASRTEVANAGGADERLTLPPLRREEVAMLVASIAVAEPPGWSDALTTRIHAAAGGSPFAVLQFLRLAMERDVIRVVFDRWDVRDEQEVQPLLDRAAAVEWRLRALTECDLATLACLALSDQALEDATLAEGCGASREEVRDSLFRLEADAFVARAAGDAWRVAHDLVAEGALAVAGAALRHRCAARLAEVLGRSVAVSDLAGVRRVVRLHLEAQRADAALQFLRGWLALHPPGADLPAELASVLTGGLHDAAFEAQVRALVRARGRWWRSRWFVAGLSVTATAAVITVGMLRPVALVSTSAIDPTENDRPNIIYEVPPRIELRNAIGRVSRWRDGDTVRMQPVEIPGTLRGRPWAVLRGGVAVFDSVYPLVGEGELAKHAMSFSFTLPRLTPLVMARRTRFDSLAIEEAVLNGVRFTEATPRLRVSPGGAITGSVRVRYTTRGRDVLYVMAQGASWGRGVRDTVTVRSLLAGVSGASFTFPVTLRAPDAVGDYWILWMHGAQPTGSWLLSATNWRCRTPQWGDGNDIVTQPDSVLIPALSAGYLLGRERICDESGPSVGQPYTDRFVPLVGVRIEVR
ncbi:MAG: AAA family ATPase [Gemmatimonadota bacterium]|nr:AAA family ATPase [Gemmatimonadota bacterium]